MICPKAFELGRIEAWFLLRVCFPAVVVVNIQDEPFISPARCLVVSSTEFSSQILISRRRVAPDREWLFPNCLQPQPFPTSIFSHRSYIMYPAGDIPLDYVVEIVPSLPPPSPQVSIKIMRSLHRVRHHQVLTTPTSQHHSQDTSFPRVSHTMQMLFPFSKIFFNFRCVPSASYSVTSSNTMLTKSSNPKSVPLNSNRASQLL